MISLYTENVENSANCFLKLENVIKENLELNVVSVNTGIFADYF